MTIWLSPRSRTWRAHVFGLVLAGLGYASRVIAAPAPTTVVDLAAQHQFADTYNLPVARLDFSDVATLRYMDSRWRPLVEGESWATSQQYAAAFYVSLVPRPIELELDLEPEWPADLADHRLIVAVNGRILSDVKAPSRVRHRLRVEETSLVRGRNSIEIAFPSAQWFRVYDLSMRPAVASPESRTSPGWSEGFDEPIAEAQSDNFAWQVRGQEKDWRAIGSQVERDSDDVARIAQAPSAGIDFYLRVPRASRLQFRVPASSADGVRTYRVSLEVRGRRREVLWEHSAAIARTADIELGPYSGAIGRLSFELLSTAAPGEASAWENPRIVTPADPAGTIAHDVRSQTPPNIVIYVMDALRADHLGIYGYARDTSPQIDRFAAESMVFDNAYAHSVWTKPSIGSLLSGLLPPQHGAIDDLAQLHRDVKLLSSFLKPLGYRCLALQSNGNAGLTFGFDRDFDVFLQAESIPPDGKWDTSRSSSAIHARLESMIDDLRSPFFLLIQSVDPHDPYDPQGEFRKYVRGHPLDGRDPIEMLKRMMQLPNRTGETEHDQVVSYLEGLYDGDVRHNDLFFGRLLDLLRQRGVSDETAILLTADHGEGFHDHGYEIGHGGFFQHTVRVPLIVKLPHTTRTGRFAQRVQHVDVVPTVLELAGTPIDDLSGQSLLGLTDGKVREERTILMFRYRDRELRDRFGTDGFALLSWPWKLIQEDRRSTHYQLYNLEDDPRERRDLWPTAGRDSILAGFLQQESRRLTAQPVGEPERLPEIPEAQKERMRQLGYIR